MGPVGHGKSTAIALVYPMWRIARDKHTRVLIVSKSEMLSRGRVARMRWHLQFNKLLTQDYGRFYSPHLAWSDKEAFVDHGDESELSASIKSAGIRGTIEGWRGHLIICDDVVDLATTLSKAQTSYTKDWIDNALIPRLEPGGHVLWIGARWAKEDLYNWLIKRLHDLGYGSNVIIDPAERRDGTTLWPSKYPMPVLRLRKKAMGSRAYAGRYLLDPTSIEGQMFKRVWFERNYYQDLPPLNELTIVGGVDPSVGEGVDPDAGDLFAITMVGFHKATGLIYVLDHFGESGYDHEQQFAKIRAFNAKWKPLKICIEDHGFQWRVFKSLARGDPARNMGPVPVVPLRADKVVDKISRIQQLAPPTENDTLKWHPHRCDELIYELLQMPNADFDDRGDSCEIAVRGLGRGRVISMGEVGSSL